MIYKQKTFFILLLIVIVFILTRVFVTNTDDPLQNPATIDQSKISTTDQYDPTTLLPTKSISDNYSLSPSINNVNVASTVMPNITEPVNLFYEAEVIVNRIIDGDTIVIEFPDGTTDKVRLLGIDTPETSMPNKPGEYGNITDITCLDMWGDKATEFLSSNLPPGTKIHLYDDLDIGSQRDKYERLLAYIHSATEHEIDYNAELVKYGLARVYTEIPSGRESKYLTLQKQAIFSQSGLWKCASTLNKSPSAICKDGTVSYSTNRSGTCSHHGGVQTWK